MKPLDSNSVINVSSTKAYIFAVAILILAFLPFMGNFPEVIECQEINRFEQNSARHYGLTPQTCFQYYLNMFVIPSVAMASPFVFLLGILLFKEKKKEYQLIKPKQERVAFWLSIFTILIFLLSFVLIRSIPCEGFGCLGLAPLIALVIGVFPPLIFGFSLWFFNVRYQWGKRKFLVVTISLILLLLIAYAQTPLL